MESDFKSLIEKYKSDLMKFSAAHPQQSAPTSAPPAAPAAAPGAPAAPNTPAAPGSDPITPRYPGFVPGPEPEQPHRPQPATESPEVPQRTPAPQPEQPIQTMPQPEMPQPARDIPEVSPRNPVPEMRETDAPGVFDRPTEAGTGTPAASDAPGFDPDKSFPDRNMSDTCLLKVRVSTAREAAPIAGAHVEVTRGKTLAAQLVTDESGSTQLIELDCVDRALSTESGSEAPYTVWDISVSADGFYPTKNIGVPLFGGVTTVQDARLIPVAEFGDQSRVIRTETPEMQL